MIKFVEEMKKLMEANNIKVTPVMGGTMMEVQFPWTSMAYGNSNSVYGYRNIHDMIRMNGSIENLPTLEELGWTKELEDSDPSLHIFVEVEKKKRTAKAVDKILDTSILLGKVLLVTAGILWTGNAAAKCFAK